MLSDDMRRRRMDPLRSRLASRNFPDAETPGPEVPPYLPPEPPEPSRPVEEERPRDKGPDVRYVEADAGKEERASFALETARVQAMNPSTSSDETDLRLYLQPFWARKWLIIAVVLIATGTTYAYFASQSKEYTASTSVFVQSSEIDQVLFGSGASSDDPERNTQNQATLITSRGVAQAVSDRIGFKGTPEQLLKSVDVRPAQSSDFVVISATHPRPSEAASVANGFARSFIRVRAAEVRQKATAAREVAESELEQLGPGAETGSARSALRARIRRLQAIESLPAGRAEQVDPARPPSSPSAPKPLRNSLFAFFISLVLAVAGAYALERFDRRIKRVDELESLYGLPVLGVVPHARETAPVTEGSATMADHLTESMRALRTSLQLAAIDQPLKTILVTSAVPAEGKSTVVRNLALAYKEAGLRVAVLEADFRRPSLSKLFGIHPLPGFTNVLTGQLELDNALQEAGAETPDVQTIAQTGVRLEQDGQPLGARTRGLLAVLTSGPEPPNPPAVLGSRRVQEVLEQLRDKHDVVLIDSPPLLAVSDAMPLFGSVDGVVVVARLGVITREAARRLATTIHRASRGNVLGLVANDQASGTLETPYYYQYYRSKSE